MKIPTLLICTLTLFLSACGDNKTHSDAGGENGHAAEAAEFERGPHRGRMLRQDDFAIEVTIFETGVPPEFHLYAYKNDKPISPNDVQANIKLLRTGNKTDNFSFRADGDHLVGSGVVIEPHSFDVEVSAKFSGRDYSWKYDSYEGRTTMPAGVAKTAGLTTEQAGPATIAETLRLMGRVAMNEDRRAQVSARFPGLVQAVRVQTGDTVRAGQTLAVVENSDSLRSYNVTSPINGIVLERLTNVGDVAGSEPLFEIADLSQVWVELHAFGDDAARLGSGLPLRLSAANNTEPVTTTIQRVLPMANAASQSVVVRALLPNTDGRWRPGMAVTADVTLAERSVPIAVKVAGLQRFRDFTVVFAQFGDTYEVRMLELGQQDGEYVEVLGGIDPGTRYVVEQSFLIKADVEKSGASHDH